MPALAFRLDDYSAHPAHATNTYRKIVSAFSERRLPLTVAVTPSIAGDVRNPRCSSVHSLEPSSERWQLLQAAVDVEIALHGLRHRTTSTARLTEFSGLSRIMQGELLDQAVTLMSRLTSHKIHTFVPPWNDFDVTTTTELRARGMTVISTSVAQSLRHYGREAGVRIVPSQLSLHDAMAIGLRGVISLASVSRSSDVVITMHEYEFREGTDSHLKRLRTFLDVAIDEGLEVRAVGACAGRIERPGVWTALEVWGGAGGPLQSTNGRRLVADVLSTLGTFERTLGVVELIGRNVAHVTYLTRRSSR